MVHTTVSRADGARPACARMLPALLRAQGYRTAHVGKWMIGENRSVSTPAQLGFEYSYGTLDGGPHGERAAPDPTRCSTTREGPYVNVSVAAPGATLAQHGAMLPCFAGATFEACAAGHWWPGGSTGPAQACGGDDARI